MVVMLPIQFLLVFFGVNPGALLRRRQPASTGRIELYNTPFGGFFHAESISR